MKKFLIFCICACSVLFLAISCSDIKNNASTQIEIILDNEQVLVSAEEGGIVFNYKVTNPVEGGVIEVVVPDGFDWIKVDSINVHDEAYGMITLQLAENVSKEFRNAVITVKYNYDGKSVSDVFNLIQENIPLEYEFVAKYGICQFWGNQFGDYNYHLYLTETDISKPVAQYCKLDLYTKEKSEDMLPLPGVYTVVDNDYAWTTDFSLYSKLSTMTLADENGKGYLVTPVSGEITVEKNDKRYDIHGNLFDKDGKCYRIKMENVELTATDNSYDSQLSEDIEATYTDMLIKASNHGDIELPNTNLWFLTIGPKKVKEGDPILQLTLFYDLDVTEKLEACVFTPGNYGRPATFLPGYFSAGYDGSWYFTCNRVISENKYDVGSPIAPFKTGQIELIEKGEDVFDVIISVEDDNNNTINITCKDVPVEYEVVEPEL